MKVPKRLRFEVLTRDGFTCQYCGATKDDAKLAVDHVIPQVLGGTNDPSNLITACEPCNSGKSSRSPSDAQVAEVDTAARQWADAMAQAAAEHRARKDEADAQLDLWFEEWTRWSVASEGERQAIPLPGDWRVSIRAMLEAGADLDTLIELVGVAMTSKAKDVFRYWCGCSWNHVTDLHARARELVTRPSSSQTRVHSTEHPLDALYWSGHDDGYAEGFEAGYESGQVTAKAQAAAADRPTTDVPVTLRDALRDLGDT